MNKSISKSIERGMHLSLTGSELVTETTQYVLEHALGRKVTADGYATSPRTLRKLQEAKDEVAAKRAADAAAAHDMQTHHYEFSRALDSVGLAAVFHPENLNVDGGKTILHRGPNDDALTHQYHNGAHYVALARRTGAGTRVGYGSHPNPRDALMMAIRDFNSKRPKGVNESANYRFDGEGKYGDSMTEVESLDELSKDTLASYIRKASIDARHREFRAGRNAVLGIYRNNDYRESDKDLVKSLARQRGIGKASDKLVDRVNEAAPPDMEDWVKANKARFVKEYGDKKGHEVLYATAWKLHDKKANEDTLAESGTIEVIPHQVGITKGGKIVSPFSAGIDHVEKTGKWTWGVTDHNGNYTTGMSRTPVDSRAEAEKIAHDVSAKTGYKVKVNESTLDELHPETAKRYMHKAIRSMIRANDDSKFERRSKGISRAAKRVRGDFHPGQGNIGEEDDSLKLYLRHEPSKSDPGHRDIAIYGDKDATIFKGRYPWEHRSKPNSRSKQIVLNKAFRPVEWLPASDKIGPRSMAESEQDNIDHVKRMKAYHAAVKATDDASMAKVHFRMRHDISQPDHREAYNQLKRKHREARKAEAAAAEHVKGVLFAKDVLGEGELNELSRQTLRNYVRKAVPGLAFDSAYAGFLSGLPDSERSSENERRKAWIDKSVKKRNRRLDGIALATDKLAEDRLDELSPATIRSYLTKAIADHSNKKSDVGFLNGRSSAMQDDGTPGYYNREKTKWAINRQANKRMKGIQRAIDNLGDDTQRPVKLPDGFGESVLEAKDYSKARKELADLLDRDFHTLRSSEVTRVVDQADAAHYRKPKDANRSRGRYFHELLRRRARKADEAFVPDGTVSPMFSNK